MVKIIDVNKTTLELCRAADKAQLLAGLPIIFNEDGMQTFRRELVAIGSSPSPPSTGRSSPALCPPVLERLAWGIR